jgi:hypothetical protein
MVLRRVCPYSDEQQGSITLGGCLYGEPGIAAICPRRATPALQAPPGLVPGESGSATTTRPSRLPPPSPDRRRVGGASSAYRNAKTARKPDGNCHRFDSVRRWTPAGLVNPIRDTPQRAWVCQTCASKESLRAAPKVVVFGWQIGCRMPAISRRNATRRIREAHMCQVE